MFWKVGILVTALAAAISASDISQENEGIDTTGALLNITGALREMDSAGVLVNNTDLLRISEEAIESHNGNSLEERRGCFPTPCCTRAGGYCIRRKADCNGTVDTQGCRGGRKCKCCIPNQTTPAPLTCPTTQPILTCPAVPTCPPIPTCPAVPTCPPIPTCPAVPTCPPIPTCPAVPTCPPIPTCPTVPTCPTPDITTIAIPTTNSPTTNVLTTLPVTTEGSTLNPNLNWLSVGSERFVRFPQEMSWFDARRLCQANGLDLFEPKNIQAVAIYLEDNFNDDWYWVGSRGNGTHVVWLSGGVIPRSAPWYSNYYLQVGTDRCTEIITWNGESRRGTILAPTACTRTNIDVLCG